MCFVSFCVLFVCKCVQYYCHRVATQLQLTNMYHNIIYALFWNVARVRFLVGYRRLGAYLNFEGRIFTLSRNVCNQLQSYAA